MTGVMKWTAGLLAAGAVLLGQGSARAGFVVDFEGVGNNESVLNFYNGGLDSAGNGPGPNSGVTFTGNAIVDAGAGVSGGNVLFFVGANSAVMDVAGGFTTNLSFAYSSPGSTGFVTVFGGLAGTGPVLTTLNLAATPSSGVLAPIALTFGGAAQSVEFGGTPGVIVFDNIAILNVLPGNPTAVPGPAGLAVVGLGSVVLGLARGRRRPAAV